MRVIPDKESTNRLLEIMAEQADDVKELCSLAMNHFGHARAPRRRMCRPGQRASSSLLRVHDGIGRNSPCPCGSGKKYKKCCRLLECGRSDSDRSKATGTGPDVNHGVGSVHGHVDSRSAPRGEAGRNQLLPKPQEGSAASLPVAPALRECQTDSEI